MKNLTLGELSHELKWICILVVPTFVFVMALCNWNEVAAAVPPYFAKGSAIDRYQTLITGVLALFSALITVRQMRSIDGLAADRHSQQMDLLIRPDKLTLQRGLVPNIWSFISAKNEFEIAASPQEEDLAKQVAQIREHTAEAATALNAVFKDPLLVKARTLFNGITEHRLVDLAERAAAINMEYSQYYHEREWRNPDLLVRILSDDQAVQFVGSARTWLAEMVANIDALVAAFEDLEERYKFGLYDLSMKDFAWHIYKKDTQAHEY